MILEAVKYMFLGMGIVFLFLYLMVIVLDWQHKLLIKYFPQSFEDKSEQSPVTSKREKLKKVAAITAALHHMKNSK